MQHVLNVTNALNNSLHKPPALPVRIEKVLLVVADLRFSHACKFIHSPVAHRSEGTDTPKSPGPGSLRCIENRPRNRIYPTTENSIGNGQHIDGKPIGTSCRRPELAASLLDGGRFCIRTNFAKSGRSQSTLFGRFKSAKRVRLQRTANRISAAAVQCFAAGPTLVSKGSHCHTKAAGL